MSLSYIWKLSLKIWKTNIEAQKINNSVLESFGIIITNFQVEDKVGKFWYFQKFFFLFDTKFKVILKIFFLKLSNIDILFNKKIFI